MSQKELEVDLEDEEEGELNSADGKLILVFKITHL